MLTLTSFPSENKALCKVPDNNPQALELREKYGDFLSFSKKFSPANARYCSENLSRSHGTPKLIECLTAYGHEQIESLLCSHLSCAVMMLGNETRVGTDYLEITARGLCNSDKARLLSIVSIVVFIHRLGCGYYSLYDKDITPRRIMEAFHREFYPEASQKEYSMRMQAERVEQQRRDEESLQSRISWDDYIRCKIERFEKAEFSSVADLFGLVFGILGVAEIASITRIGKTSRIKTGAFSRR